LAIGSRGCSLIRAISDWGKKARNSNTEYQPRVEDGESDSEDADNLEEAEYSEHGEGSGHAEDSGDTED
jgi:hypothetical protein